MSNIRLNRDTHWVGPGGEEIDVSVVLPCLNEAETLAGCIGEAQLAVENAGLRGEIIVADNGSVDDSTQIALKAGASVVDVPTRGYGAALRGGINAAAAPYVVMGDADGSYDFGDLGHFVEKLREGFDLVIGNRFQGGIAAGAMPASHRWIGNPVLSWTGRLLFRSPVGDFHCGLRAIRRSAYQRLALRTTGMEFASEMVVRAELAGLRITEIPTKLRPDGRSRPPHLRSIPDGWRHLRFMLLLCPRWLFILPGLILMSFGAALQLCVATTGGLEISGIRMSVNTAMTSVLILMLGYQLVWLGIVVRMIGQSTRIFASGRQSHSLRLEYGLGGGLVLCVVGAALFASAWLQWQATGFGDLPVTLTLRRVVPSITLIMLGAQTIVLSLLVGAIDLLTALSPTSDSGLMKPNVADRQGSIKQPPEVE